MPATANASPTSSATSVTAGAFVLHSFGGPDGAGPAFGIISDKSHAFYGTTIFGGSVSQRAVFKLAPQGSGYREEVIYSLKGGSDGDSPFGRLVMDRNGALYVSLISRTLAVQWLHEHRTVSDLITCRSLKESESRELFTVGATDEGRLALKGREVFR